MIKERLYAGAESNITMKNAFELIVNHPENTRHLSSDKSQGPKHAILYSFQITR